MIAGRLRWRPPGKKIAGKLALAGFVFSRGTLFLTEAGTTRRASMHLVRSAEELAEFDRGGLEILAADRDSFAARLCSENHTLKRALTDPRLFSGIGNAYSDEILHRARLSPVLLTSRLTAEQSGGAVRRNARDADRVDRAVAPRGRRRFSRRRSPRSATEMAVHGRYPPALPRLRRAGPADSLCDQRDQLLRPMPDGRQAAGRSRHVRLLKQDWPKTIDD